MNQIAIGNFIAKKRKEQNLTQEQLAEKLGVSNKTVSKWECGNCMPDYSVMESLCKELGITISQLLDCKEQSENNNNAKQIRRVFQEMETIKTNKKLSKLLLIGIILLVTGTIFLAMSFVFKRLDIDDFIRGYMFGVSLVQLLLGVTLSTVTVALKISRRKK